MRLTVVGCSGSYPGPDSPASSYLVEEEHEGRTWRILLDLGNGALGQLHRYVDPLAVDGVFLSHLHADHCLDMCGYYVLRKYHPTGPAPRIPVWGPEGTPARMASAYDLPEDPGMTEEFDFRLLGTPVEFGPFRVESVQVAHPVTAYALRVSAGGRTLVYTGDTGPCAAIDELAVGADVLLAEASFESGKVNPPDLHLTGAECGELATRAGVGGLLLTHIPPWHDAAVVMEEARAAWTGPLGQATAGAVFEI
ncbi:MAG: MBL fold metallo-hydrolase [Nocardioides sp.]|uniref:MBL fold metallo-hydrolase n=1 Tax=Nocardioides sp. TaxID=35761 RepID=UPI003F050B02